MRLVLDHVVLVESQGELHGVPVVEQPCPVRQAGEDGQDRERGGPGKVPTVRAARHADPGSGSGFLLFLLVGGRRGIVLHLVHPLLELLDARAQGAGQLGQTVGAEQDQHDDQNDQKFLIAKTKHAWLLSREFTLARPYPARKTRRSPTRAVTRRASKYSRRGIAYLREIPRRSLISPGPISLRSRRRATSFSWILSRAAA